MYIFKSYISKHRSSGYNTYVHVHSFYVMYGTAIISFIVLMNSLLSAIKNLVTDDPLLLRLPLFDESIST